MYYSLKTMTFRPNSKSSSDKKNIYHHGPQANNQPSEFYFNQHWWLHELLTRCVSVNFSQASSLSLQFTNPTDLLTHSLGSVLVCVSVRGVSSHVHVCVTSSDISQSQTTAHPSANHSVASSVTAGTLRAERW